MTDIAVHWYNTSKNCGKSVRADRHNVDCTSLIISANSHSLGIYHIIYWSKNTIVIYEKYLWTTVGFWTQKKSVESTIKKFAVWLATAAAAIKGEAQN